MIKNSAQTPHLRNLLTFVFLAVVFQFNILKTSSELQFKTYRDGSEALVLGKIFSDAHGIDTYNSNMGFIEKASNTKGSDVLSVYERIDHPKGITPLRLTDTNWTNGFSNHDKTFIIQIANTALRGYASNELLKGQKLIFPDGQAREVVELMQTGNFLNVSYSGKRVYGIEAQDPYIINVIDTRQYAYSPYPQQFGIQAIVLSWIYRHIPFINTVFALQFLMAAALAAVITLLIREFSISISAMFAGVFFLSMIGSPWIVAVARNLYWASFLWFLPAVAVMMAYRTAPGTRNRLLTMAFYCFSIFLKCLAGYEYISTIIIFSLSVFLIDPFKEKPRYGFKESMKTAFKLGCLAILGFLFAILVHSFNRADTIAEGLSQTLGWDALKYSALGSMTGTNSGPDIPLSFVLSEYINEWKTPVLFWFGDDGFFRTMLYLAAISLAAQLYAKDSNFKRDTALLTVTALAPLSWFILVQKHSAIHVHLNYVLWYIGFVPALIFVILRGYILIVCSLQETRFTLRR